MARKSKFKYIKGDEIGFYRIIKTLPSEPHVKNLRIYCECLLCGEKVVRWSNRLDSKHRGCKAQVEIKKEPEPLPIVAAKQHTRADGTVVEVDENGRPIVAELETEAEAEAVGIIEALGLPDEVKQSLNVDFNGQVLEMVKRAESLDSSASFLFKTTLKRYLTLISISRKLESKIAKMDDLMTINSNGNQVASPVVVQYKSVSAESNAVVKVLNNILLKSGGGDADDDPLAKILGGK